MTSAMMSNGDNNNIFEPGRRNDSVAQDNVSSQTISVVNLVERSHDALFSEEGNGDEGTARVALEAKNTDNNCSSSDNGNSDASLLVDSTVSDEVRVLERVDEGNDFRVREIKEEDENSKLIEDENDLAATVDVGKEESEEKGKAVEIYSKEVRFGSGTMENKKLSVSEDYNSMLSMFDEFAQDGNPWAVGYGYEIGDMVWGKVKSHPWWPGHIYSEAFASPSVRRSKREGHVLVAFFGDSSYGWFELAELIPFEPNLAEKSRQTNSRTFLKAVEEAVDEVNRRSRLGLACRCRNAYNFRPSTVEGFYAVDLGDNETGGVFSASQIKRARDSFRPHEMLAFVKKLALTPMTDGHGNINFVKHKARVLAFRKAVYEEFDETYAQAFGAQPVRPEPKTAADLQREPSRAPLSGRLVFAEALGKGKASAKTTKPKDRSEKDRYLFKRRDEPSEIKTQKAIQGQLLTISEPIQIDGGIISGRVTTSLANQELQTTGMVDSFRTLLDQSTSMKKAGGQNVNHQVAGDPRLHAEGSRTPSGIGPKKPKVNKRPLGQLNSVDSVPVEKKKKKRKKEVGLDLSSDRNQTPAAGVLGASVAKVAGNLAQVPSGAEGNFKVDSQRTDDVRKTVQGLSVADGGLKGNQKKGDAAVTLLDTVGILERVDSRNIEAELHKCLCDLQALALNPFHGAERSCPLIMRKVFLKFRSLVYQKSLVSLVPIEAESAEAYTGKSFANASMNHVKEMSTVNPQKPQRPEDPTIGGRKRGPSDRQEEMAAKRKKKVTNLKSLTTEKKSPQKAAEAHRKDAREAPGKSAGSSSAKSVRSEAGKKPGLVVKAPDPTMLIMKFPPGSALPSLNELKAKFTRFGTLDASKMRVYWQSSQCRLVYLHRSQAELALKFASGGTFGGNVRCYLRDLSAETPESGSLKVSTDDAIFGASQSREPGVEQRQTAKSASQLQTQLKSCLKKASGDEGGSTNGGTGGRVSRVKFLLGGDESSKTEQLMVGNRNLNNNASFADGGASSSSHAATMDFNSKNIQKVMSSSQLPTVPLFPSQSPKPSNNLLFNECPSRSTPKFNMPLSTPNIDIAQQMISLLTQCNDVVSNLKVSLGYVPYHPL